MAAGFFSSDNLSTSKIRNAFSDAARDYDGLTVFHQGIGCRLVSELKKIKKDFFSHKFIGAEKGGLMILDVGMGTGAFTDKITRELGCPNVIGLDSSVGMVEFAKKYYNNFQIILADANTLPFKKKSFDIITSNLAYQWVDGLAGAFSLCYAVLNNPGVFCFSMFGRGTFNELFFSLERSDLEIEGKRRLSISRLVDRQHVVDSLLDAGFEDVNVSCEHTRGKFPDMLSMIRWIKNTGANALKKNIPVSKNLLAKTGNYYDRHFKDGENVYATFEIIWARAKKR